MLQTLMYLLFCSTYILAFSAALASFGTVYKAVCVSSILWSTYLFALTEGLNVYKAITSQNIIIGWGVFLVLMLVYCLMRATLIRNKVVSLRNSLYNLYYKRDRAVKAIIWYLAIFMILRTVLAIITVPYNHDSMTYHLSRVMYWIQHQSVDYYETAVIRQLYSPVFAEYINLNMFLFTGGDLFANMLQNLSSYGVLLLLYGIIRRMGCGIKWALFGCILATGMNIFFAESLTTQVDMVGAFYLMILIYMMIEVLYEDKILLSFKSFGQFALLGLVSGLIYITKTNVCIPAAVIVLYVVLAKLLRGNFKIIFLGLASLICICAVVFTTFARNYEAFNGDFMANVNVARIATGSYSPRFVILNVAKNLVTAGFERNSELLNGGMKALSKVLKVDLNSPEISFGKRPFEFNHSQIHYSQNMDIAGAHLVIPLFLIVTVICLWYVIKRHSKADGLCFALIMQIFSILIALRWQPWSSRLLLPSLIAAVVPIVYYFQDITSRFRLEDLKYKICFFLVLDLIFQCGLCSMEGLMYHSYVALNSIVRPRYAGYFGMGQKGTTFIAYNKFSDIIDAGTYQNIGLDTSGGSYHYPVLAKYVFGGKKVESVRLIGEGRDVEPLNTWFTPDIILAANVDIESEGRYTCNGKTYKCQYSIVDTNENTTINPNYSIWVKEESQQ